MAAKGSYEFKFQERQIIEEMLKLGYTIGGIAVTIGRSHCGVKNEILRNGGRKDYTAEKGQNRADICKKQKIRKIQKGFTESQVNTIKQCLEREDSINSICKLVGCSHFVLRGWLDKNQVITKNKNYTAFAERITNLEQQIEILLDLIKEMKNV